MRSLDATNDAVSALKSFCVTVTCNYQEVVEAARAQKKEVPPALISGLSVAGNTYPIVVVLDPEMKQVFGAVAGNKIYEEGKKVFREAKKKYREYEKEREKDD